MQKFVGNAVGYVPSIDELLPMLNISSREVGKPLCEVCRAGGRSVGDPAAAEPQRPVATRGGSKGRGHPKHGPEASGPYPAA